MLGTSRKFHLFRIEPNAWMEAFGITEAQEQERTNQQLRDRIAALEERARKKRAIMKRSVMGRERLMAQVIDRYYQPQRSGCRMWCLSEDKELRVRFIQKIKGLIEEARLVYERWFVGDFSEPYPLGLYPPSMPKLAEPLGAW